MNSDVAEKFSEYLRLEKKGGLAANTIARYFLNLKHLEIESGLDLFSIKTYSQISSFIRQMRMKKNWSTSTTKNAADSYSVFYTWALRHGHIQAINHPLSMGHEFKNTERKQMDFFDWDSEDFKRLLYHPQNSIRDSAILHTLRSSGLRAAELCGLTFNDADMENRWLYVRNGKGGKDRYAPFDGETKTWLDLYIPQIKRHTKQPWLFQNEDFGQLSPHTLWAIIRRKADRLGIRANPQMMRRSLGGAMIEKGADLSIVQQVLGHSSVQTTANHYVRFKRPKLKEQYDKYIPQIAQNS